ncbi:hypothetical protein WMY93_023584 [Mugilogobius chulae]|uniref:TIR domain-containing protein n=1 Tax=Mugilogobius chulae TaxID=88201 RepID=A0AAW0N647_9GOBI
MDHQERQGSFTLVHHRIYFFRDHQAGTGTDVLITCETQSALFPYDPSVCSGARLSQIMEVIHVTDSSDAQSYLISAFVPPPLREDECYHVFLSYSSIDYRWTHSLVDRLEDTGLKVCYHERDFTPGRTILENMSECIQQSQKVLLVLSAEFVRSRWCLLEANMSLFRDCLERKPIVPVLLDPDICVPLHLCHLTYLEANHPDFINKLLHVLCTPNRELRGSSVVPYQPPSVYNGKALQPLTAVNEENLYSWDAGVFSDMDIPDQLRLIVHNPDTYREALAIVNKVSQTQIYMVYVSLDGCRQKFEDKFSKKACSEEMFQKAILFFSSGYACCLAKNIFPSPNCPIVVTCLELCACQYVSHQLSKDQWGAPWVVCGAVPASFSLQRQGTPALTAVNEENLYSWDAGVFSDMDIPDQLRLIVHNPNTYREALAIVNKVSQTQIYMVYVSLDGCRQKFEDKFSKKACSEEMFQRAILFFSSGYTCCLAKKHFSFSTSPFSGHLPGAMCFCQYVSHQLSKDQWIDQ